MKRLLLLGSVAVVAFLPRTGVAAQPPVARKTFKTVFRDFDVSPGKAHYYVRVFQRDS
ncbi:MAG: hypothetical protein HQ582_18130 [Planctomycetes bacterium]|nr:hypothetical protein [Planctomycetota bacterium]